MKNSKAAPIPAPAIEPRVQIATDTGVELEAARDASKRTGSLQRLLAAWRGEIADVSIPGRRRTVSRLEKALRLERARGRAGHWAYDVARHQQLAHHLRLEQAALRQQESRERQKTPQLYGAH